MNIKLALSFASLLGLSAAPIPTVKVASSTPVTGDYVEARTASVFAGACHYNGERVTTGHDAILAWNVTAGTWNGTNLAGVRAVAALACDDNLAEESAARRYELVVDPSATSAQAAAFAEMLKAKLGSCLGSLASTRRAPVSFEKEGQAYRVQADGFAELSVQPMPDNECCSQPSLVWYTPIVPLDHRKVGYADHAAYTAGTVGDRWQRDGENDAFYGPFSL